MIDQFSEQSMTHSLSEAKCSAGLVLWLFHELQLFFSWVELDILFSSARFWKNMVF